MATRPLSREDWERYLSAWLEDEGKAKHYAALFDHNNISNLHTLVRVIEDEPRELKDSGVSVGHRVVIHARAKELIEKEGRFRFFSQVFGNIGLKYGGMGREFLSCELWRAGLAEGVASGIYVFCVSAVIIASGTLPVWTTNDSGAHYNLTAGPAQSVGLESLPTIRYLSIATGAGLAFGFTSYLFAAISGGHITPAITLAYTVTAEVTPLRFLVYVAFQLIGAMIGNGFIKTVSEWNFDGVQAGRNLNQAGENDSNSLGVEVLTTFILIVVVLSLSDSKRTQQDRWFGHLQLGFVFWVVHLISLPINGTGMDPCRSFATAALSGYWAGQWPLWVGPGLGSLAGVVIYETFIREKGPRHPPGSTHGVPPLAAGGGSAFRPGHSRKHTSEVTPLTAEKKER
jgi:glycerol uptake facilitator-like aquaporin